MAPTPVRCIRGAGQRPKLWTALRRQRKLRVSHVGDAWAPQFQPDKKSKWAFYTRTFIRAGHDTRSRYKYEKVQRRGLNMHWCMVNKETHWAPHCSWPISSIRPATRIEGSGAQGVHRCRRLSPKTAPRFNLVKVLRHSVLNSRSARLDVEECTGVECRTVYWPAAACGCRCRDMEAELEVQSV